LAGMALSIGSAGLDSMARRVSPLCWETQTTVVGRSRRRTQRTKARGPTAATQ